MVHAGTLPTTQEGWTCVGAWDSPESQVSPCAGVRRAVYARTLLPPLPYKACGGERCFCDPYRARTPADPLAGYPRGAASGATQSHPKGSRARPGQQLLSDPQVPPCQRKAFAQAFSQKALPLLHCAPGGRLELCSRFKPFGFLPPDVRPYWQSGWWFCAEGYPVPAP